MNSKKINQLATELTPSLSDLTIIGDPSTGVSKKITLSQMASLFTGTVEEYPSLASFPLVGVADTIYIATDTNILYRWDTTLSAYAELSPNIVTSLVFSDANGFDGTISLVGSVATLTITTALTTGSVPFIGASGALSQDNDNLFWDDTNNRLGIGTKLPTTALDVFGSGIIGRINGTSTNNAFLGFASSGTNKWSIGNVQSDHRFRIYNEATTSELVSVLQTGEFGIGIANPTTKVHIDGGASALIANLDANVSVAKSISFRSDNSARINLEVSGTESGSNAGADFFIRRYSDAGALIDTPLTLTRSTGYFNISTRIGIGAAPASNAFYIEKSIADYVSYIYQTGGASASYGGLKVETSSTAATTLLVANGGVTRFSVIGDGTTYLNGALGIGQSVPKGALHIGSDLSNNTDAAYFNLKQTSTTATTGIYLERSGERKGYYIYIGGGEDSLTFQRNNAGTKGNTLSLTRDGNMTWDAANTSLKTFWTGAYGGAIQFLGDNSTSNRYSRMGIVDSTGAWLGGIQVSNNTNVLIGTLTDPNSGVIVGSQSANNWSIYSRSTASSGSTFGFLCEFTAQAPNNTTSYFYYGGDTSTARFNVRGNGGIYNFSANNVNLSDISTKKDIIPCESYWNKFKAIEIVKFKYIDQSHDDYNIGVIAQQVEQVAPEFIDEDNWAMPNQEDKIMKAVYTEDLHHATIKVLQEAMAKIESLEAEVAILKNK
jgi:Chaperone of endosialidase